MPTCPNGHQSGSDDWCEVCGHRMAGAVPPPPPPPPTAGYGFPPPGSAPPPPGPGGRPGGRPQSAMPNLEPELCPQCRTPREGGAPFCEECRWNFLTNTATSYTPAAPRPPAPNPALRFQQGGQTMPGPDSFDYERSRPSQVNRPAEPIPPGPPFGDEPSGPTGFGGASSRPSVFGNEPPRPPAFGGDTSPQPPYGTDPTRPGPPPGPAAGGPGGQQGGAPGAPSAFQGGAPSVFRRPTPPSSSSSQGFPPSAPPQQGGPSFGGGDEDWVISPPSHSPAPGAPAPGAPGAGGQGGGYGFPQPGAAQAPPSPYEQQPATWTATIGPDREYFMAMMQRSGPEAAGLNLPAYSPEQQRTLTGNQITIGRRRHSTGDTPDIDLSVPPEDPGVSHQHALLVQQPDGSWAVVDQNSTNGTTVNGGEEPIQPFVPVPLQDGDRVHVGAWTTITIRRG
ncbi:ABC transporter ATP-binding/permease protein [Streptomyces sp. MBT84]|uniref:FHA domain-containing protein n=1 Tax=Streptomyces sp. MBT84 TaxID=1488414 RepID=UPI001C6E3268|nr:FHA domain-containing protein [Streptomyces sp. MBT84]MBW8703364.1 ABC transporter ATP-binding/permease protein [Streptomyces sp. MBT84]